MKGQETLYQPPAKKVFRGFRMDEETDKAAIRLTQKLKLNFTDLMCHLINEANVKTPE